jgi:chaperonin cofactor prefoldin
LEKITKKRKVKIMRTIKHIFAILILAGGLSANLGAQDMISQEKEWARLDSLIQDASKQRSALSRELAAYAKEIQELKSQSKRSYFQQQRLERLLKDSQDVANQIEKLDSQIHSLQRSYLRTANRLVYLYDSEISKGLKQLENQKLESARQRELLAEVERLRRRSELVKEKAGQSKLAQHNIPALKIEPDDSPKQIEQKADLLKDQEDKLRVSAQQVEKQARDLKKEMELRTRMNDLVTDLAMFDQQEEALGNVNTFDVQQINPESATDLTVGGTRSETGRFTEQTLIFGQKDFDFSALSPEQLEEVIANLKKHEERLKAQADSLARQAEAFYKAAKESKKPQ